ncbi:endonuclease/exonuclease/phosphatase family protein [Persicitalea sp.]|uniref:endonuclease/exonuclease/phosphatase family protein n=1 Tax=Persicitalea sp. TaxID=3100273 RepID=UPI003593F48F
MKRILLLAVLFGFYSKTNAAETLRALSFNIRYATEKDGVNAWSHRKDLAASVFTDNDVDFAGLQEALLTQINDLQARLPNYAWIGVGRDDGKEKGEFSPIFYRKDRFKVIDSGTFWLSKTPEVVASKDWDAAITRIATWAKFKEIKTGKEIMFVNTHFDHVGETSRQESAKVIAAKMTELAKGLPTLLTGDFNTPLGSKGVQTILDLKSPKLYNTQTRSATPHFGGEASFNGFKESAPRPYIDFVFATKHFKVQKHGFVTLKKDDVYVSDHWPVLAELRL